MSAERNWSKRLTIVHGVWPESENFNSGKKGYHRKGHLKRSIMVDGFLAIPAKKEISRGAEWRIF